MTMIRYYSDKGKSSDKAGLAAGTAAAAGGGLLLLTSLKKGKKLSKEELKKLGKKAKGGSAWGKQWERFANKKEGVMHSYRGVNRAPGGGWYAQGAFSEAENQQNNNSNMEIRRKLFSVIEDENGEERYYSTTEFSLYNEDYDYDEEKLFSTGDSELDEILEEAYYSGLEDGYDYAYEEREYAEKEEDKESSAGVAAAGAGAAGATLAVGKRRAKKAVAKGEKEANRLLEEAGSKGKALKAKVDEAYMNARASEGGLFDMIKNEVKYKKGSKAAGQEAESLLSKAKFEGGKVKKLAGERAEKIGKRSKVAAAAVLGTGGLIAAGKAIKNSKKKSE